MATLKAVTTVENLVNKILSDRMTETAALTEKVKQEVTAIAAANEAVAAAMVAGDVKAYQKAKAERRNAEDAKEMHDARLEALTSKPLISKADYEKAVADIYGEIAALDDQKKQRLAKLSEEMEAEALDLQAATTKANEVLYRLQSEIYKNADRSRTKEGRMLMMSQEDKKVDRWPTINWGKAGVTHYQYAGYTGRKVQ